MKLTAQHTNPKKSIRTVFIWMLSFLAVTAAELILLVAVSMIPRSAIQKNTQKSAEYFMQKSVFFRVLERDPASNIDHYADAILLNVLYNYDSAHPITSSLSGSYYYTETHNENENLLMAVTSDVTPTYDYFRYWHGSTVLVRPLLTFLNINQIYILFAVVLTILTAILLVLLFKYKYRACAWSFILALPVVSFWYIPMSLEYIWCFFIMLLAGIFVLSLYKKNQTVSGLVFFLIGNITAFFDFLSTETLTLLVPLALLLTMMYENNQLKDAKCGIKLILARSIHWGIGYLSAWIAKWTITSVVLRKNIFGEALSSASVRVNSSADMAHGATLSIGALLRNIACLFPFNFIKNYGYALAIGAFLLLLMFYYLYRKDEKKNFMPWLFMIVYLIPYIRFLILANHSYIHYFFTYRAQFASIFCLFMFLYYGLDKKLINKTICKKRKKRFKKRA